MCLRDKQELCTVVLFGKVWRGLNGWRVPQWSGDINKWANGLMHIDGARLMILAHTLPILCPGARWEQLCWGGWADWGLQWLSLYPLLSYRRCHQGSGVQHWRRASGRVLVSLVIRHATPAGLAVHVCNNVFLERRAALRGVSSAHLPALVWLCSKLACRSEGLQAGLKSQTNWSWLSLPAAYWDTRVTRCP